MPFAELSLAVVGARHPNQRRKGHPTGDRQMEILLCEPGERVELRPEPDNKADQNAIGVYSERGVQLGYISADRTMIVHRAIAEARTIRAVFQQATGWGCAIRVTFDGNDPVLPPDTGEHPMQPDDGWQPDPDYCDGIDWVPPDD